LVVFTWSVQLLCALVGAGMAAAILGSLSWVFFVVGLVPLCLGLGAGSGALLGSLISRGAPSPATLWASALAMLCAWVLFQGFDDHHFRTAWANDLAQARAAGSGLAGESPTPGDEVAFFAPDADAQLSREVLRQVGFDGPVARWWVRAHQGIRLLGPWEASRGLPVGPWGALAWSALELVLGVWIARRVLSRAPPQGP